LSRVTALCLTAMFLAVVPVLTPASAQDAAPLPADEASSGVTPADATPLTPEESVALAAALQYDPAAASSAATPLKIPGQSKAQSFDMTRAAQPNGSETYTLKRVVPTLNAKVGADLGTGAAPAPYYEPDRAIAPADRNTGAAWASVDVSTAASVDARVDPSADQGRLATTLHRSVPFGSNISLTVQNSSGVTNSIGTPVAAAPAGLPMRALPQATTTGATQTWDDQPSVKFDVVSTGTSFSAGLARTSADPVTHNRIGAEQKLYGPLHVSTAVSDVGETTESKSISAGIKLTW